MLNAGRGSLDTVLRIGRQLATLRLEDARATRPKDERLIEEERFEKSKIIPGTPKTKNIEGDLSIKLL